MKKILIPFAIVLIAAGVWRFTKQGEARTMANREIGAPPVRVAMPVKAATELKVALPGSVRPKDQVTLYARSNGFLRQVFVDLGDTVKKDQVLARIDAPDLGASLAQTNARLAQANAALALVAAQHERTVALGKSGNLSPQDIDASALRLRAAESEKALATAEHDRLGAMVSYLTVKAPFEGTINRRYIDDGALVASERTALFDISTTDNLQIDVDVPQWAAAQLKAGMTAQVVSGQQTFTATVMRTAGALDPTLRTLRTELKPGPEAKLLPGAYVKVSFNVPRDETVVQVPSSSVAVRNGTPTVAVVGAGDMLRYVPVKIVRELGRDVEVLGDIPADARVALYPPASLADGDVVRPVMPEEKKVTQVIR